MDGEEIGLFNPSGILLDSVAYRKQHINVSYGRSPNITGSWNFFIKPTPEAPNGSDGILDTIPAEEVIFSVKGGFYHGALTVELHTSGATGDIIFTTDGSWPTVESLKYEAPIFLTQTTVLRARNFDTGKLPGRVRTQTYILNDSTTLPVISITAEPDDFFSGGYGIYVRGWNGIPGYCYEEPANWYRDWERPVNFEYF
ncbi:MAG: chitobiase/beta-hexosaminidase C-terminal domain-containing protein, partial [Bacteroidales bacterium]|nr:chitobiase/beta-hexosaminidase C-terminal domain-containing protein [Bacteroidales bacterium]